MKQQLVELERIHFTRVFPWVHLFQAFRIALDVRKMFLGGLALLLLSGGLYAISFLPLEMEPSVTDPLRVPPWTVSPVESLTWQDAAVALTRPIQSFWEPALQLLHEPASWMGAAFRWTQILWAVCLWSLFGTAISRMAAVQFAVDSRVNVKDAVRFAGSKWLWVVSAPLMPMAGILGLWLCCVAGGWIANIPSVGPVLVGVLWIIPLGLSFAIVLLLIGLALGWPLMIATISTQGSDAFDGFSRSFDYVYSRFWHLMWFLFVTGLFGGLMLVIVAGVASLVGFLAANAVAVGLGTSLAAPGEASWLHWSPFAGGEAELTFAARCVSGWLFGLVLMVKGYAVSYFWSACTIIYFLLRQSEDANHLSEVYLPKSESKNDLVQLAGVAASDQPIIERPAKHKAESRQPAGPSEPEPTS